MNMSGNAIRYEQDTASFCVRERIWRNYQKHMVTLTEITGSFLYIKVYKTTKRLNVVGTEFIFEAIKMLTLEIKFMQHKNNNYV